MMNNIFPAHFRYAQREAEKSQLDTKVGACLVVGKSIVTGHNKAKTHPKYANPLKHIRKSLHAELDCFVGTSILATGGTMITFRAVHGHPALARPCEHCMEFLKEKGIKKILYSVAEYPYWKEEEI